MTRWKRALEILVLGAVSLAVVYLVGGNLFLAIGLRRLVAKPTCMLGYGSAWTVWPGRVHVKGFHIQGQSDTVEWMLAAEMGAVDLDLLALFHREIHLRNASAVGMRFRLRLRVMPGEADAPEVLALPPIAPYDDPPIRVAGAMEPEILRGKYRHWVARIDDSDAEVTEIWVGHYRFEGVARSRGGFYVAPHRSIAIGPAKLDVSDGVLSLAGLEVARDVVGRITCTIDGMNPDVMQGRAVMRAVSGDVKLDAQVPSLAFLGFYVPPSRARFDDGGGPLHTDLSLRQGHLAPGSLLQLETDQAWIVTPAYEILSDASLSIRVGDDRRMVAAARVPSARVWRLDTDVAPASIMEATAAYTTADGDLADGLGFAGLTARVPRAQAPDLRWLTGVHDGKPVRFDAGSVTLSTDLEVDASLSARSHAEATVAGVVLVVKDARLHGDFAATSSIAAEDVLTSRKFSVTSGTATLSHVVVTRNGDATPLGARADIESGTLDFTDGFALSLASHAAVTGTSAVLDLVGAPRFAKAAAAVFGASTARASATMAYDAGLFTLKVTHGASGATRVKGEFRKLGKLAEAAFVVKADPFSIGILLANGHVQSTVEPGDRWLDEHRPKITGAARPADPAPERLR